MKKNIFFYLVFVLISFSCKNREQAEVNEADDKAIRELMRSYSQALTRSDWPSVLKMIHPGVFNYISKRDFEKELEESFTGENFKMHISAIKIDSVYPVIARGPAKYSLVEMNAATDMIFTDTTASDYSNDALAKVCEGLKQELGKDLSSCTTKKNGVGFVIVERCYVAYLPDEKKWFCVTKDAESSQILDKIIPADVRKELGF